MLHGHLQALGNQPVHQPRILETLAAETGQAARVDHHRLLRREPQEALVGHVVTGMLHDIHVRPVVYHLDQKVLEHHPRVDGRTAVVRTVLGLQLFVDELEVAAKFLHLAEKIVFRDDQVV